MFRLKDPLLPAYLYDRLYKILISGYYAGPFNKPGRNKYNDRRSEPTRPPLSVLVLWPQGPEVE